MNSEELELSLRTEFENYLNSALSELKNEVAEFQKRIDSEFDKHRSQVDEAFKEFTARLDMTGAVDRAFQSSVTEHLRLARDEGAKIAATAFAEAEDMAKDSASAAAGSDRIRNAVEDISSKQSQSAILNALIDHCSAFAPRGAFFIVKNDSFRGWRVFGSKASADDEAARDLQFPVSGETLLGRSVESLNTTQSSFDADAGDSVYLEAVGFGRPNSMYAVPLVARGRGVAVLYADGGEDGGAVNIEALETLVRVAGLTVELLASAQTARPQAETAASEADHQQPTAAEPEYNVEEPSSVIAETELSETQAEPEFESFETSAASDEYATVSYTADEIPVEIADESAFSPAAEDDAVVSAVIDEPAGDETYSWNVQAEPVAEETVAEFDASEFTLETNGAGSAMTEPETPAVISEFDAVETPSEPEPVEPAPEPEYELAGSGNGNGNGHAYQPEPVVEAPLPHTVTNRLRERNVDLPIEVAEDERRFHNDARRFARLLVSEIKLYNEQQVKEGREANDLYRRLREAIDRSREMYEKRVKPPVASKFDYFHYELVSTLAEGDENRLGGNYPGASV